MCGGGRRAPQAWLHVDKPCLPCVVWCCCRMPKRMSNPFLKIYGSFKQPPEELAFLFPFIILTKSCGGKHSSSFLEHDYGNTTQT